MAKGFFFPSLHLVHILWYFKYVLHLHSFFVSCGLCAREKVNPPKHFLFIYRLVKEKMMYEKEAKQQEEKIEKMKAEDGENYAIKKQVKLCLKQ